MKKKRAPGTPPLGTPPRQTLSMRVAGVPVRVNVDGEGRPYSATAGFWRADDRDHAPLTELAAKTAFAAVASAAQADQRKTDSAKAAVESAKTRATKSVDHWANKWFALAHAEHPHYGTARLAQRARSLAAQDKIDPVDANRRDEISVDRAQQFLDRQRGPRG